MYVLNIEYNILRVFSTLLVPDEFQYDPMSNSYGDPTRRPEIKNATIEFIAPAEYMVTSCSFIRHIRLSFKLN